MPPRTRKSPATAASTAQGPIPNSQPAQGSRTDFATPVRALGTRSEAGYILLRDVESQYRDGSEERILEILQSCSDVSADSDEALTHAQDWAERYHTTPARANVVRNLPLPADATVLEIGAGCGAVTRYLGENCAVVDALEPVPARAAAATERCRDLPNVQVLVGELDDLPAEPAYDIAVVVGVLEYVGSGTADLEPYRQFLSGIAARLKPSGSLVLAIENKLGVKYLVGAPEDHSGRVFDSLEGYPYGAPARTFSRQELESLIEEAGLTPRTSVAFPDYKLTRTVLRPQLLPEQATSLLYRIPNFPSPDWLVQREHLCEERLLWRSLVEAGLALDSGNSFVVVAGKDGVSSLWDESSAGMFFSMQRRRQFTVKTDLQVSNNEVSLVRSLGEPLRVSVADSKELTLATSTVPFSEGVDFLDVFVDVDHQPSVDLLTAWVDIVRKTASESTRSVDMVPHNMLVDPDRRLVAIDEEWHSATMSVEDVLRRGALLFALRLAEEGRVAAPWHGSETFVDVAQQVANIAGVGADPDWFEQALRAEAKFLHAVSTGAADQDDDSRRSSLEEFLRGTLQRGIHTPVDFTARIEGLRQSEYDLAHKLHAANETLAEREHHLAVYELHVAAEAAKLERAQNELDLVYREKLRTNLEVARLQRELTDAQRQVEAIRATFSYRLTEPLRVVRKMIRRS